MAKIVQLKMAGNNIYPRTTTDQIAFVREDIEDELPLN